MSPILNMRWGSLVAGDGVSSCLDIKGLDNSRQLATLGVGLVAALPRHS